MGEYNPTTVWKGQRDILLEANHETEYVLENLSLKILFNAELSHESRSEILQTLDTARKMMKSALEQASELA